MCDYNRLIRAHHKIDDARKALKKQYAEEDEKLIAQLEQLETKMLGILNENFGVSGTASIAGPSGTFYREDDITPRADDWDSFYRWVAENNAFEALERRITKRFIKEYMATHVDDAGQPTLPPGVSVFRKFIVRVRRSK